MGDGSADVASLGDDYPHAVTRELDPDRDPDPDPDRDPRPQPRPQPPAPRLSAHPTKIVPFEVAAVRLWAVYAPDPAPGRPICTGTSLASQVAPASALREANTEVRPNRSSSQTQAAAPPGNASAIGV